MAHSRSLALAAMMAAFSAAGCASAGARATLARPAARAAWQSASATTSTTAPRDLTRWWEALDDPTLTHLIDGALAGSPDVHAAQARLRQARAQQAQAAAELWPTVSASGSASARRSGTRAIGLDGSSSVVNVITGSYGASLDASWEPDIFGGLRQGRNAATADLQAAAADLDGVFVSLAAEVGATYAELRTLQARMAIAGQNAASQAETLELTGFRAQAGLVSSVDVEQARANLEQTRAGIPTIATGISQAMFRLATLSGVEPGALVSTLSATAPLPALPASVAIGIPAETLRQRPDVRAAERRVAAETARLAQADTRRYPTFSLSGTLGIEILKGAGSGGTSILTSVGSNLARTLFDRGRIRQQIEIQSATQEQAVASYESTVLTALEDVERALVAYEKNGERLTSLTAAADAANNATLLARSQYAAGLSDFQTVLNTERTLLSVQESVAVTEGDRVSALVQLYKALGGGWTPQAISGTTGS